MALGESNKLGWRDIANIPLIDLSGRDQTGRDQTPKPLCADRIVFIVVGRQAPLASLIERMTRCPLPLRPLRLSGPQEIRAFRSSAEKRAVIEEYA